MATIVGALAVELGLDTAEFTKGLQSLPGLAQKHFSSFSAEAKRNVREGAEGLRIFDEAFGLHISRPIARIIAQDFPQLAKAFASVLGPLAGLSVGVAVFGFISDGFGKIGKAADDAKKKEEEFVASTHALEKAVNEESISAANSLDRIQQKLSELSGDKSGALSAQLRIISRDDAEQAVRTIDAISEAYARNAKAAAEAESASTRFWLFIHNQTTGAFDKANERITAQAEGIRSQYNNIVEGDPLNGLEKGAAYLKQQLEAAQKVQTEMHRNELSALDQFLAGLSWTDDIVVKRGAATKEEVKNYDALVVSLAKQLALAQQFISIDKGNKKTASLESAERPDTGEKQLDKLKSETEADLALAAATSKTTAEQKLAQAAGEADQIISRIQEEAHGRLTAAIKEELLSVHALTAERLLAKDSVQLNQELQKETDSYSRQITSLNELSAAYIKGGPAIAEALIGKQLEADQQKVDQYRKALDALKAQADEYAKGKASLGEGLGPVQGLQGVDPEAVKQLESALDAANAKLEEHRKQLEAIRNDNYDVELNKTAEALRFEQPYLDALNVGYGQNEQAVRRAHIALSLFHWEQAHPGATPEQIQQEGAQLEQQSVNQQRAADAQLAARYNIVKSYDDEIAKLERAREVLQQYGQSTLEIDAAIYDQREKLIKQWDDAAFKVGDFHDKYQAVMNELVLEGEQAGHKIADSFLSAIHGAEDDLAKFLTGQKVQPQKIIQNLAEQQTRAQIQRFTGEIAGHFGVEIPGLAGKPDGTAANPVHVAVVSGIRFPQAAGSPTLGRGAAEFPLPAIKNLLPGSVPSGSAVSGAPDGSSSNPFYVVNATPEGTPVGKSAGDQDPDFFGAGIGASANPSLHSDLQPVKQAINDFSQALLPFGGGLAAGGSAKSGTTYLVGENGPELFRSSTAGDVTPNSALPSIAEPSLIAGGNQPWTFNPSAPYAQTYESYERWLHRGPGHDALFASLGALGADFLLKDLLHPSSAGTAALGRVAAAEPAQSGVLNELDSLTSSVSPTLSSAAPPSSFAASLPNIAEAPAGGGISGSWNLAGEHFTPQGVAGAGMTPEQLNADADRVLARQQALYPDYFTGVPDYVSLTPWQASAFQGLSAGSLPQTVTLTPAQASAAQGLRSVDSANDRGPLDELNVLTADQSGIAARADGGPVDSNNAYLVGEKGPEVFRSSTTSSSLLTQFISRLFHNSSSPSPAGIGANLPANKAARNDLDALTASQVRGSSLPSAAVAAPPLPNATRAGDIDAGYYRNWAREYSVPQLAGASSLKAPTAVQFSDSVSPITAPSLSAQNAADAALHPNVVNLSQFPSTSDFAISLDGFRAAGGAVHAGATYMVGERGPELFRPRAHGEIIPNHMLHTVSREILSPEMAMKTAMPSGLRDFAGFMADGGDVFAGRSYLVGERGPEAYRVPGVSSVSNVSHRSGDTIHGDVIHGNVVHQTIKGAETTDLFKKTSRQQMARNLK